MYIANTWKWSKGEIKTACICFLKCVSALKSNYVNLTWPHLAHLFPESGLLTLAEWLLLSEWSSWLLSERLN